jgi:hypothetical protein
MKTGIHKSSVLLPAVAAVGGIIVFAATFFAYANAHATVAPASYAPFLLGSSCFAALVGLVTYAASLNGAGRLWQSVVAALVAGVSFVLSLLFVLVNTFGS